MGCSLVSFLTGSDFIVSVLVVIVEDCFRHHSLRSRHLFHGVSLRHCEDSLASLVVRYRFLLLH